MNEEKDIENEINIKVKYLDECVICCNGYDINDGIIFSCSHSICLICYQKLLNDTIKLSCPLCRREIEVFDINNEVNQVSEQIVYTIPEQQNEICICNIYTYYCIICINIVILCLVIVFFGIKDYIR